LGVRLTTTPNNSVIALPIEYVEFLSSLDLKILKPMSCESSSLALTGYPQGLTRWEIQGGIDSLKRIEFWHEYDQILKGFLDFYNSVIALPIEFCEIVTINLSWSSR
jgi:hypothetical protein